MPTMQSNNLVMVLRREETGLLENGAHTGQGERACGDMAQTGMVYARCKIIIEHRQEGYMQVVQ